MTTAVATTLCGWDICNQPVPRSSGRGRPKLYCSPEHEQEARNASKRRVRARNRPSVIKPKPEQGEHAAVMAVALEMSADIGAVAAYWWHRHGPVVDSYTGRDHGGWWEIEEKMLGVALRLDALTPGQIRNLACELLESSDPVGSANRVSNPGGAKTAEPYPHGGADTWPHVRIPEPGTCLECKEPAWSKDLCRRHYDAKRAR